MIRAEKNIGKTNKPYMKRWPWWIVLAVQVIFLIVLFIGYMKEHVKPGGNETLVALDALCTFVAILFYLSIFRSNSQTKESGLFLALLSFNSLYLFMDAVWQFVQGVPSLRAIHIMVNVVYLICPIAITLIYWKFLDIWVGISERFYKWTNSFIYLVAGLHIFFDLLSPLTGWYFVIPQDGSYIRGNLYILTIILPLVMVLLCVARILYHRVPLSEMIILLMYLMPPVVAAIVQGRFPGATILAISIFLFVALLYTNYYVRKEAEISGLEHDLTKSNLKSLQMQINPHFLYNTLHSIAGLCDTDPRKAQEMIYRLSDYMRDNFTDIDKPTLVYFEEELEQLDHYLAIELMRFPNISVIKDIETSDFLVPVSSLQPLVENAIKHGIGKRKKSKGVIRIAASQTKDAWMISVSDDGVGFDVEKMASSNDGHFGLENVRRRLEILCSGEIKISSEPDQGTTVRILIPKNTGGGTTTIASIHERQ